MYDYLKNLSGLLIIIKYFVTLQLINCMVFDFLEEEYSKMYANLYVIFNDRRKMIDLFK